MVVMQDGRPKGGTRQRSLASLERRKKNSRLKKKLNRHNRTTVYKHVNVLNRFILNNLKSIPPSHPSIPLPETVVNDHNMGPKRFLSNTIKYFVGNDKVETCEWRRRRSTVTTTTTQIVVNDSSTCITRQSTR
jgi:hypothetical protein